MTLYFKNQGQFPLCSVANETQKFWEEEKTISWFFEKMVVKHFQYIKNH